MSNTPMAINKLLMSNTEFIMIGLTGRTGSGCTTTANLLHQTYSSFPEHDLVEDLYSGLDKERYKIISNYTKNNWINFDIITISNLLTLYVLKQDVTTFKNFIKNIIKKEFPHENIKNDLSSISDIFDKVYNDPEFSNDFFKLLEKEYQSDIRKIEFNYVHLLRKIKKYSNEIKTKLNEIKNGLYIKVYQDVGNSIRKIGTIDSNYDSREFNPENIFIIPELINTLVKIIKKTNKNTGTTRIVIDTIRNPYEVKFFRDRYSAFHLISINTNDEDRQSYLRKHREFKEKEISELDSKESGNLIKKQDDYHYFISQNVKKCIELSDIHFYNPKHEPDNNNALKAQIAWYVGLILHPGLITPTTMERTMQIANVAKLNSGCISRQVGAVILDKENSIKAVGWNDVPKGQVPCSLRSLTGLHNNFSGKTYSPFELNNTDFRDKSKHLLEILSDEKYKNALNGLNKSYCFKDIKNQADNEKNQVHTRSLHAEENAFLQISKYGGTGIQNGKLYTTASPCELCAKKAYQLGIKEIIFIDPYPGIAKEHILESGETPPKLIQFRGAIGRAYHKLYEPIMPYKDEIIYSTCGKKIYKTL